MGQQVMYSNLRDLREAQGDTVSTLRVLRRTKKQMLTLGGADYRIVADDNSGLSRYLRVRCYAVEVDGQLYVNCRKMRYRRYKFGHWYAPAMMIDGRVFFRAQPLGQLASSSFIPIDAVRLGGDVGNAIAVTSLVNDRVYYELDMQTGRSSFLSKERMRELLASYPEKQAALDKELTESAAIMQKYLTFLENGGEPGDTIDADSVGAPRPVVHE